MRALASTFPYTWLICAPRLAEAVEECNQGINLSAGSTASLVEQINQVYGNVEASARIVRNLNQQSDAFAKL